MNCSKLIPLGALSAAAALTAGCAFSPGEAFATVSPALSVRYEIAQDRERPGGFARLASDYEIAVSEAQVGVEALSLLAHRASEDSNGAAGGAGAFDPANPPPGYSNCHGGHCHHESGALVPYEDIQAELSGEGGGGPTETTLMAFEVHELIDARAGDERELGCTPDCGLDRGTVDALRAGVSRLVIRGTVRDSRATPRVGETAFTLELSMKAGSAATGSTLSHALDLTVDREHFPSLRLNSAVVLEPRIFDRVDWAQLAAGAEGFDLDASANEAARAQVLDAFAAEALQVEVIRSP